MATFANIGLSQPASDTVTHQLDAVVLDRGAGSTVLREVMVVGSPETTNALAAVLAAAPASTAFGLVVRVADPSTVTAISSLSGRVATAPNSTTFALDAGFHFDSSGAMEVKVSDLSTLVSARLQTSSGGAVEGSTASPAISALGFHVRQVPSSVQSVTAVVTSSNSTAVYALVSSVAAQLVKVAAYFIGCSTSGSVSTLVFMSSLVGDLWGVTMSSGTWGANLSIPPPQYLFKTAAQSALNCRIESASTAIQARISLSFMQEP